MHPYQANIAVKLHLAVVVFCACGINGQAQVQYDSNATVIVSDIFVEAEQDAFSVPAGDDRILVVFVSLGSYFGSVSIDSLLYQGVQLVQGQSSTQGTNEALYAQLWYVPLGSGAEIIDTLKVFVNGSGVGWGAVIGAASYNNVDQSTPIGLGSSSGGSGFSATTSILTSDSSGLIIANCTNGEISTSATITATGIGQVEIFNSTNSGNQTGEGSYQPSTGSWNTLLWSFNVFIAHAEVASELLVSGNDLCPYDPAKTNPGICGCGVADTDTDGDGTPDCDDLCPADSNKIDPGFCGCGFPETDMDGDGTPDCIDLCPADSNKIAPGICGCGISDIDSDSDGTPDCDDLCPADSNKIEPGICGCGLPDIDSDGDGTYDCNDMCPFDPDKTTPGFCGCGTVDTDSDNDGTYDCDDLCPHDPLKTDPGQCGCWIPDIDSDGDGIADCNERGEMQISSLSPTSSEGPGLRGNAIVGMDTSELWFIGNLINADTALTFIQRQPAALHLGTGNRIGLTIDKSGLLGINGPPLQHLLKVHGTAAKATPGNWLGHSDLRLKSNIVQIDPQQALKSVLELQGVSFEWNDDKTGIERPSGVHYGLIAQDIEKAFPDMVRQDPFGYLQTAYGTYDPIIVESIRALQIRIEKLTTEVGEIDKTSKRQPPD